MNQQERSEKTNFRLNELPPPPPGKSGWPWTEESPELTDTLPDGRPWPKITVVTPSFNQGRFLEETIRSIVLQRYPNLEYIVIDGGSTDESVEIIRKYEPWLTYWESEPDRGQSHAINKGLARASGELFNWVNSDDFLSAGALGAVGRAAEGVDMIAGGRILFGDGCGEQHRLSRGLSARQLLRREPGSELQQLATWVRRDALHAAGSIDESMHHAFDPDFYIRYLHHFPKVRYVNATLGWYRKHDAAKTVAQQTYFLPERLKTVAKLRSDPTFEELWSDCEYAREKYLWWLRLTDIVNDPRASGLSRAVRIVLRSRRNPSVCWDEITRRAVRNLIVGHEIRPYIAAR